MHAARRRKELLGALSQTVPMLLPALIECCMETDPKISGAANGARSCWLEHALVGSSPFVSRAAKAFNLSRAHF
jgi:hypothetical protein